VLEAVLVKTKAGSAWTVRFGAKGGDEDEVIVAIALDKLHEMSLARSYSVAKIRALTDVTAHVAGESAEDWRPADSSRRSRHRSAGRRLR
jgi:hypothetical protein